jgi:hypothetical protein
MVLGRLGQIHNAIAPVPRVTLISPKAGQQPCLVTVIGTANGASEEHESAVTLTSAQHLACVPRKRRPIKGDDYQPEFRAGDQERRIVQTQPRSVLPRGDVHDGKLGGKPATC